MSILEVLKFKDLAVARPQTDQNMTVVPIVGLDRGNVADPSALSFVRTTSYGTMVFKNSGSNPAIVPSHTTVRTRGGQDHAMSGSGIVAANKQESFDDACCIESSQGGMLSKVEDRDVLPVSLRRNLLDLGLRRRNEFGKLWKHISAWLEGIPGIPRHGNAHLRYFYDHKEYKEALENFVAAFEPVPNQLGAIILFSGVPVGIEIFPTRLHWISHWQELIRGCYGAELIRLKALGRFQEEALKFPEISKDASLDEAAKIVDSFVETMQKEMAPLLDSISLKDKTQLGKTGQLKTELILTDAGGGGDLVTQGEKPIYLSMVL